MDNCQSGCPCDDNHYNCTLYTTTTATTTTTAPILDDEYIDDLTAGKLVTIGKEVPNLSLRQLNPSFNLGNVLDGECFSYNSYLNSHSESPFNNAYHESISTSASTPQACINYCKSNFDDQYTYAIIQSSSCYCGNAPPDIESSSCSTPCSGDSSKICGGSGSSASFYTVPNQSEFCN